MRCSGCDTYHDREGMVRLGLAWCCNESCRRAAVEARRPESWRPARKGPSASEREKVKERDGHRCRYCGSPNNLTIHHVSYRSEGGGHDERNLLTLCQTHHDMVHSSKYYWQPVLGELLRLHYEEQTFTSIRKVERLMQP